MSLYNILTNHYDEIAELAAAVGIDWNAHCNDQFPFKTNAAQTKTIDKKHKGACGIIADIKVTKDGREYPFIYFKSFKEGGKEEKFSGYRYLSVTQTTPENAEKAAKAAQKRKTEQAEREAAQAAENADIQAQNAHYLSECKQATSCEYFKRKGLEEYTSRFFPGAYYNPTKSKDYPIQGTLVPYFSIETRECSGFEYITQKTKLKSAAFGHSFAFVEGSNPEFEKIAIVGEGVATTLSVHKSLEGEIDAYIAGGASNIKNVVKMLLSSGYERVYVLADNDHHGASLKACKFNIEAGSYSVHMPPMVGDDFSDVYMRGGASAVCEILDECIHGTEYSRYFTLTPRNGAVNIMLGEKGTGKTTAIKRILESNTNASILVISHRIALGSQIARDFDLDFYDDIKELQGKEALNNKCRIVVSPEALAYVNPTSKYDFVIIDESEQLLQLSTHSSTMNGMNRANTQVLRALCCNAVTVILADANAGTGTDELAQIINENSHKSIVTLTNTYKPRSARGDSFTLYGGDPELTKTTPTNAVFSAYERAVHDPVVFISDSKDKAEQAAKLAESQGKKGLLLTSKTMKDHSRELTRDPVSYVNRFDVVAYSPCFGTGFSVDEGHKFKKHTLFLPLQA